MTDDRLETSDAAQVHDVLDVGKSVQAANEPEVATGDVASDVSEPAASSASALPQEEIDRLTHDIIAAIKTVYDPEIPVDIYELGLIYKIDIDDDRNVAVDMTLTAPGCPVAGEMPIWVKGAVTMVEGVGEVTVDMVFEPPWDISLMSDEARVALNMW